jgi:hypothetical protein
MSYPMPPEPNEPIALSALREELANAPEEKKIPSRPPVRRSFRSVRSGMFGTSEIVVLALSGLFLLSSLLFYAFWVIPAQSDLKTKQTKRDELEAKLVKARAGIDSSLTTEQNVAAIVSSIDNFEVNALEPMPTGQARLYQTLNQLIRGYGLRNTNGPDYAPLETLDLVKFAANQEKTGRSRFQSLYPGVYVTMTLEGPYANLRRFIRDVENSRQFIVISTIELETSDNAERQDSTTTTVVRQPRPNTTNPNQPINPNANTSTINVYPNGVNPTVNNPTIKNPNYPQGTIGTMPDPYSTQNQPQTQGGTRTVVVNKGKTKGEVVSLRLEMAAYFRRDLGNTPQILPTSQER